MIRKPGRESVTGSQQRREFRIPVFLSDRESYTIPETSRRSALSKRNRAEIAVKSGAAALVAMAGAAQAQDLQGLYAGLSYSKGSGEAVDSSGTYSFDGNAGGAFVGYNHVFGDWLVGGELAFSNGDHESFYPNNAPYMDAENVRDIKLRAGRVFGKTLVYGVVGRSSMDIDMFGPGITGSDGEASATAIGLGFEAAIGAKAFVGGEYLRRDLDLSSGPAFYADQGARLNTLSLRLGLRF